MYISWARVYEGASDAAYFDTLIRRVLFDVISSNATRNIDIADESIFRFGQESREISVVAREICAASDSFDLVFIHADAGTSGQEAFAFARAEAYAAAACHLCGFSMDRYVCLVPRREMESWALADAQAVCRSIGFSGEPRVLGIPTHPADAERLGDPKAVLQQAVSRFKRRIRSGDVTRLLSSIAQMQSLECLRECDSFRQFEICLTDRLSRLGVFR